MLRSFRGVLDLSVIDRYYLRPESWVFSFPNLGILTVYPSSFISPIARTNFTVSLCNWSKNFIARVSDPDSNVLQPLRTIFFFTSSLSLWTRSLLHWKEGALSSVIPPAASTGS